jgi:hypothetical protein
MLLIHSLDNIWSKFPGFQQFMEDKKRLDELKQKLAEAEVCFSDL